MRANLSTLTTSYGICHFQETHLLPNDKRPLTRIAPHHTIFTSNLSSASAGVSTAISPDVLHHFSAQSLELHPALQGYALATLLTPRAHGRPIVFFNLYLNSASYSTKTKQLQQILDIVLPANAIYFASGDFNFVESPDDTSSPKWSPPPRSFLDAWEEFLARYQLRELHQPTPTFYRRDTTTTIPLTTSRLDRQYSSLTELDYELLEPSTHLAALPHGLLTSGISNGDIDKLHHRHQGSDHLAVGTRFDPRREAGPVGSAFPTGWHATRHSPTLSRPCGRRGSRASTPTRSWSGSSRRCSPPSRQCSGGEQRSRVTSSTLPASSPSGSSSCAYTRRTASRAPWSNATRPSMYFYANAVTMPASWSPTACEPTSTDSFPNTAHPRPVTQLTTSTWGKPMSTQALRMHARRRGQPSRRARWQEWP